MGFFSFFFGSKNKKENVPPKSKEGNDLLGLNIFLENLLSQNKYISKKEYTATIADGKTTIEYFTTLQKSGMLKSFCKNDNLDFTRLKISSKNIIALRK